MADLGTICLNTINPALPGFRLVTTPTPLQRQALDLLGVSHRILAASAPAGTSIGQHWPSRRR
jgi:hypothetical protein